MVFKPSFPRSDCLGQEGSLVASDSTATRPDREDDEPLAAHALRPQSSSNVESEQVAPCAPSQTAKPRPAVPSPQDAGLADRSAPRVLLADDNRDLHPIFRRQLNLLGLEVVGVTNGREAALLAQAALAAEKPFDLILMDMEMPIIDGYEATRRIRDSGFSGPIFALSAHSADDYRQECIKLGCNDCITKPIDWSLLTLLIRTHVARALAQGLFPSPNR